MYSNRNKSEDSFIKGWNMEYQMTCHDLAMMEIERNLRSCIVYLTNQIPNEATAFYQAKAPEFVVVNPNKEPSAWDI